MDIARPGCLIENLITTPGAWLLSGPSKHGKTVFAMQLALEYQAGGKFLDEYAVVSPRNAFVVQQDDKLGIASVRDILDRYEGKQEHFDLADKVEFELGEPFFTWLAGEIRSRKVGLVILDSYTSLRPERKGGDVVKNESQDFGAIDELAIRTNCVIVIIHHDSKGSVKLDWDQRAAGSYGIQHAVQGIIRVSRVHELGLKAPERLVQFRGHHITDEAMVLSFVKEKIAYQRIISGPATLHYADLAFLRKVMGDRTFSPKDLMGETGLSRASANRMIRPLYEADALQKTGYGCYKIVP